MKLWILSMSLVCNLAYAQDSDPVLERSHHKSPFGFNNHTNSATDQDANTVSDKQAQALIDAVPSPTHTPIHFKEITHVHHRKDSHWRLGPAAIMTHPDSITPSLSACLQKQAAYIQAMLVAHPRLSAYFKKVEVTANTVVNPSIDDNVHASLSFYFESEAGSALVSYTRADTACGDFDLSDLNWFYSAIGDFGYAQCPSCYSH